MNQLNGLLLVTIAVFAIWLAASNRIQNVPAAWRTLLTGHA